VVWGLSLSVNTLVTSQSNVCMSSPSPLGGSPTRFVGESVEQNIPGEKAALLRSLPFANGRHTKQHKAFIPWHCCFDIVSGVAHVTLHNLRCTGHCGFAYVPFPSTSTPCRHSIWRDSIDALRDFGKLKFYRKPCFALRQTNKLLRHLKLVTGSLVDRKLTIREEGLLKRRKDAERLIEWKRKLDEEEKKVLLSLNGNVTAISTCLRWNYEFLMSTKKKPIWFFQKQR